MKKLFICLLLFFSVTIMGLVAFDYYMEDVYKSKGLDDPSLRISKILPDIDYILVEKEKRLMSVFHKNKLLKTYKISLGFSPKGHKEKKGDGKTPEGIYFISHKNSKSRFHLSLKVSYPNQDDQMKALKAGISSGGDIMIHGLKKPFGRLGSFHTLHDWTLGCIAVTNEEIEEIYPSTATGTKIEIRP